jgi:hypothetical protein
VVLIAACSRTTLKQSQSAADPSRDDEIARMDFWDAVAKERAVCNRDALRALLLNFEIDPGNSDEKALATARRRGWISDKEELVPLETARVGWIAKAVCIETGIKGGVTMRVFGPRERYAVNELNYRHWLANMTPAQAITGTQLMALLGAAEDHAAGGEGAILEGAN